MAQGMAPSASYLLLAVCIRWVVRGWGGVKRLADLPADGARKGAAAWLQGAVHSWRRRPSRHRHLCCSTTRCRRRCSAAGDPGRAAAAGTDGEGGARLRLTAIHPMPMSSFPLSRRSSEGRRRIVAELVRTLTGEDVAAQRAAAPAALLAPAADSPFLARPGCPPPYKARALGGLEGRGRGRLRSCWHGACACKLSAQPKSTPHFSLLPPVLAAASSMPPTGQGVCGPGSRAAVDHGAVAQQRRRAGAAAGGGQRGDCAGHEGRGCVLYPSSGLLLACRPVPAVGLVRRATPAAPTWACNPDPSLPPTPPLFHPPAPNQRQAWCAR